MGFGNGFGFTGSGGGASGGGPYKGPSPSTVTVNDLQSGSVLDGLSYDTLFAHIFAPNPQDTNWQFYNGQTTNPNGIVTADFSIGFSIISILEMFWFKCTQNANILIGTTAHGMDIGIAELTANVPATQRIDYPCQNGTVIYLTGITASGGTLTYKTWVKQ